MSGEHIVCTGGGTAGHVVPAIPVMEQLLGAGCRVSFIGSNTGLEERLLQDVAAGYYGIAAGKLRRYFSWRNLWDAFRVLAGLWQAFWLLGRLKPDAVFSKGGFVSFPVVLAAWMRRVPVVAHESDISPGLANRLALPFVKLLCVNFPSTRPARFSGRVLHTGTALRPALLHGDAARGRQLLGVTLEQPVLLVTGGSLGAEALNAVVRQALPELLARFAVVHVCGPGKRVEDARPGYHQYEYVSGEWGDLLAAADVVVSRAGANTLYELLTLKKLNVLVPLSRRVSRGDQLENAAFASAEGLSEVVQEEALTVASLCAAIDSVLARRQLFAERLAAFHSPDAAALITGAVLEAAEGHRAGRDR